MEAHKTVRILRLKEMLPKLNISRSTLYDWMNKASPRYDPTFPPKIHLGLNCVGWLESDVDEWILSRANTSVT